VEGFGDRLFKTACLLCGNAATAEDLVARTFAHAIAKIGQFGEDVSFFGWLCAILVNFRRMDLRKKGANALVFPGTEPDAVDTRPNPAEELDAKDRAAAVRMAVASLSPALREVVILRYFNDMTEAEAALALAVPIGTVKSRLSEAKKKMKKEISRTFQGGRAL